MAPNRPIDKSSLTAGQARAARAYLGWTVTEAGRRAGCGRNTVHRFETGTDAREATKRALRRAYEATGVVFLPADASSPAGLRFDA
jgi:transcriptional regulator with XRE-family HTH domain